MLNLRCFFGNKPEIHFEKVNYNPPFKDQLIFIHLNQKQDSREGINHYKSKNKSQEMVSGFSNLTKKILICDELENFSQLMMLHEQRISKFVEIPTVKSLYFNDCPTFVKSLGAWGGDFVMSSKFEGFQDYFSGKGFTTIFEWGDLII